MCVLFSSHSFWTSSSLDVPAGVTQEEGHTGFLIHLLSAVRALIFVASGGTFIWEHWIGDFFVGLEKNLNASKPSEHPPSGGNLSKDLGGNIGCRVKNSS